MITVTTVLIKNFGHVSWFWPQPWAVGGICINSAWWLCVKCHRIIPFLLDLYHFITWQLSSEFVAIWQTVLIFMAFWFRIDTTRWHDSFFFHVRTDPDTDSAPCPVHYRSTRRRSIFADQHWCNSTDNWCQQCAAADFGPSVIINVSNALHA